MQKKVGSPQWYDNCNHDMDVFRFVHSVNGFSGWRNFFSKSVELQSFQRRFSILFFQK